MKRTNFLKTLGLGIGMLIVAPTLMAKTIESNPINLDDIKWTHIAITRSDGKVYVQGIWDRALTADEICELYNVNKLLPNESISIWTKDIKLNHFKLIS